MGEQLNRLKEKDKILWEEYNKTKSENAKANLILHYNLLVRHIAQKKRLMLPHFLEFDDLVSFGNLYLIKCLEKYIERNEKMDFALYAYIKISNGITDEFRRITKTSIDSYGRNVEFTNYNENEEENVALFISSTTFEAPDKYVDKQIFEKVLNELSDKEKKLIELLYYKDFITTNEIIAKELGFKNVDTVISYKNKLIDKLRYKLNVINVKKEFAYNRKKLLSVKKASNKAILESENLINDFIDNDTYEVLLKNNFLNDYEVRNYHIRKMYNELIEKKEIEYKVGRPMTVMQKMIKNTGFSFLTLYKVINVKYIKNRKLDNEYIHVLENKNLLSDFIDNDTYEVLLKNNFLNNNEVIRYDIRKMYNELIEKKESRKMAVKKIVDSYRVKKSFVEKAILKCYSGLKCNS